LSINIKNNSIKAKSLSIYTPLLSLLSMAKSIRNRTHVHHVD